MSKHSSIVESQIANLGKRIKELRTSQGYTSQEKFAYQHGFNRTQYARYETGQDITFSNLVRLSIAFGITLEEFFSEGFEGESNPDTK